MATDEQCAPELWDAVWGLKLPARMMPERVGRFLLT
ncbi:hypothetical protein SAMN05421772_102129 [Paracoccus saliphilus]|uniref:Uncharacterized protein n=1 Tax=Paracoccus saliphilus TaxID=405559 RepID=A0AA45W1Z2_9RHOB|nr:hypothetical protein SAMN05421772_102129 [Paracoccus saliphilus]